MKLVIKQFYPASHYFIAFGSTSSYTLFFEVSAHSLFFGQGPKFLAHKTR